MSGSNEELARLREELRREREGRRQDREELRREREERRREQAARIAVEHQLRDEREDAARVQGAFRREREEHQRIVQDQTLHEYLAQYFNVTASNIPRLFPKPKPKKSHTSETKSYTSGRTDIAGKHYPRRLCLWPEFQEIHRETWARIESTLAGQRLFPSISQVESIRKGVLEQDLPLPFLRSDSFLNEPRTSFFIHQTLESPASTVLNTYLDSLDVSKILFFDSRTVGLRTQSPSNAGSTQDQDAEGSPPPSRPPAKTRPDCVVMRTDRDEEEDDEGDSTVSPISRCLVGEHKAAHRLRAAAVSRILNGPIPEDYLVQLAKGSRKNGQSPSSQDDDNGTPSLSVASLSTTASTTTKSGGAPNQVFFAYALSQAYHYLLVSGLEFGYVASGEMITFLRVPKDDYTTLFYYTSVFPEYLSQESPLPATEPQTEGEAPFCRSAISQICSLCVHAMDASETPRPASWRAAAITDVPKFPTPYDGASEATPSIVSDWTSSSSSHSSSQSRNSSLGKRRRHDGDDGNGSGDDDGDDGGKPSRGSRGRLQIRSHQPRVPSPLQNHEITDHAATHEASELVKRPPQSGPLTARSHRPRYCTQACLLGLVRRQELDYDCPNASTHQRAIKDSAHPNLHPITQSQLYNLVRLQLYDNLDRGCDCLIDMGFSGAIGYLFKITLLEYGYTFVAKGVQRKYRQRLDRELAVYQNLARFQGQLIPVYLGTVRLIVPYPMVNFTTVTDMMLLSYAGLSLYSSRFEKYAAQHGLDLDWDLEAERTAQELQAAGLVDSDEENVTNMMWCNDTQRAMRIDFDHAYVDPAQASLSTPSSS